MEYILRGECAVSLVTESSMLVRSFEFVCYYVASVKESHLRIPIHVSIASCSNVC